MYEIRSPGIQYMPLYEYKCDRCGDVFEVMQKFSDAPLEQHEGCGGHVERLLSAPALQFKGSGWYVTDYARSGSSNGEKKADKTEAKPKTESTDKAAKSESKSESSKPAATETKSKR